MISMVNNREKGISNMKRDGAMQKLGILLYGYCKDHADIIRKSLEEVLGNPLKMFSGANRENTKLLEILTSGTEGDFEENDVKVLVFLGFDNSQIAASLGGFPVKEGMVRPIFCGLTGENVNWPLAELIDHLLEEHRYFSERRDDEGKEESIEK